MKVKVNGEEREVASGLALASLLQDLKLSPIIVVVERNRRIIPRKEYSDTQLVDGDILEIVHLVGGG
jgi:thiamine biosynthesis protein ThiS